VRGKYSSYEGGEIKLEKLTHVPINIGADNNIDGGNFSLRKVKLLAFIKPISLLEILE